jgi:hypothetical protein
MKKFIALLLLLIIFTARGIAQAAAPTTSVISGVLYNVDGSTCNNCTITFNSMVVQTINSVSVQPLIRSTKTDASGNVAPISLTQGLAVQIVVTENGITFPGTQGIVPFLPTSDISNLFQGFISEPLNILASLYPPTGPLDMNNQKITDLACPSTNNDALSWGCNATVNNLTVTGTINVNPNTSGLNVNGRFSVTALTDPSAPSSVTAHGTTGATSYTYYIVCHDSNGGTTLVSPGTTVANGNAVLSSVNYNLVAWTFPTFATTCDVLRGATAQTAQSIIGGLAVPYSASASIHDTNNSTSTYTIPTRNTTGDGSFAGNLTAQAITGTSVTGTTGNFTTSLTTPAVLAGSLDSAVYVMETGGAVGNARVANVSYGGITTANGSHTLTCANCTFLSTDVGQTAMVPGSGAPGLLMGYGVTAGTINLASGAASATFSYTPTGNCTAHYKSATTWYTQTLTLTAATCAGTLSNTPVVADSLIISTPEGADAVDMGPATWIGTVTGYTDVHNITLSTAAGSTNDNTNADGVVYLGTDDTAAINNAYAVALTNQQTCNVESFDINSADCNAHLIFDPGHSYMTTGPLNFNTTNLTNAIIDGYGSMLYSAQCGVALNLQNATLAGLSARTQLNGMKVFGALCQGSEGVNAKFAWWPRVRDSTFINFMMGAEVGTNSGSGSTNDLTNFENVLFQYNGIGALFHGCDTCGIEDSYVSGFHDRGIVAGDSTGSTVAVTTNLQIDHVESNGGFPSSSVCYDIGGNAQNPSLVKSYCETAPASDASVVRLGGVGHISGSTFAPTVMNNTFSMGDPSSLQPAITMGPGNVKALTAMSNTFTGWNVGFFCGSSTTNSFFGPEFFNSVTTDYSSCNGIVIQGDLLQEATSATAAVPVTAIEAMSPGDLAMAATNGGHISTLLGTGVSPTVTTCTAVVGAGSTDNAGTATTSGGTTCVVTFGTAFLDRPVCLVTNLTHPNPVIPTYTAGTSFSITLSNANDSFNWLCAGK